MMVCVFVVVRDTGFVLSFFFFQAEVGIRDLYVTGVQTCALPISSRASRTPTCSWWVTGPSRKRRRRESGHRGSSGEGGGHHGPETAVRPGPYPGRGTEAHHPPGHPGGARPARLHRGPGARGVQVPVPG